jgi:protein-arginine kinase activator protein McsA
MIETLYLNDEEEMEQWLDLSEYEFTIKVVDKIINHSKNPKEIYIIKFFIKEKNLNYLITVDPEDYITTLEEKVNILEEYEDFERCSLVIDTIKYLKAQNGKL